MIRLYAQQNQGAVFPTYDELQLQLASPFNGKASRETVSRVLLMLRLTGWLSLCRRVRDGQGRVRGNIYAQHDEPLSALDAETLDPTWLDTVAMGCAHKNRTVSQTAWSVLTDIQHDPTMRHQHSQMAAIAERLGSPQTPQQMAVRVSQRQENIPSSDAELSKIPGFGYRTKSNKARFGYRIQCKTGRQYTEFAFRTHGEISYLRCINETEL